MIRQSAIILLLATLFLSFVAFIPVTGSSTQSSQVSSSQGAKINDLAVTNTDARDQTIGLDHDNQNNGIQLSVIGASMPSSLEPNQTELVGYWNLDDGSGNTTWDNSGNGNVGTLVNNPKWISGTQCMFGNCLSFVGSSDQGVTMTSPSLSTALSFSVWVKENTTLSSPLTAVFGDTTDSDFANILIDSSNKPYLQVYNGTMSTALECSNALAPSWTMVTMTWASMGTLACYENGIPSGLKLSSVGSISGKILNLGLAWSAGTAYFSGSLDDIRVYNYQLTPSQVYSLYNNPPSGNGFYRVGEKAFIYSYATYNRTAGTGLRILSYDYNFSKTQIDVLTGGLISLSTTMYSSTNLYFISIIQYQVSIDDQGPSCLNFITPPTIPGDNYWYDANTTVTVSLNGKCGPTSYLHLYTLNGSPTMVTLNRSSIQVLSHLRMESEQTIMTETNSATNGMEFVLIVGVQLILLVAGLMRRGLMERAALAISGILGLFALYQVYGYQAISFANNFFVLSNVSLLPFWILTMVAFALASFKSLKKQIYLAVRGNDEITV